MPAPMATANPQRDAWWLADPGSGSEAADRLSAAGLSSVAAAERLVQFGRNTLHDRPEQGWVRVLLRRFENPLVVLLLVAGGLSAATGGFASAIIILLMVSLSVVLDFVQEHRAEQTAQRLRQSVALRSNVLRDGRIEAIAAEAIVPGDVIGLAAGNLVPADGRIIRSDHLFVRQAALTGEAFPVAKSADRAAAGPQMDQASNALFMGSSIVSGSARMLVERTGDATQLGGVSGALTARRPPTSFEIGVRHFGNLILSLTVFMVLFVILVNTLAHKPLFESLMFAMALAVGLTPELLPMVITVTLSRGAARLAQHKVVVKRLPAVQDLGSMDVLCTDKTGTLTESDIRLENAVNLDGKDCAHVFELACLNSAFESGIKSPLDDAILAHGRIDLAAYTKLAELPFDFERRRLSVLLEHQGRRLIVVKGAPADVLAGCDSFERASSPGPLPLGEAQRKQAVDRSAALENTGCRVLGVAWRIVDSNQTRLGSGDETGLTFAGFLAFLDPPKAGVGQTIRSLVDSGIDVKIVTGDSDVVTRHLCTLLDIPVSGVLLGSEIESMDDHALRSRVEAVNLFCRVNPIQKNRVIQSLKACGRVVGYLGDGINDAPALHSADVGISVDGATDVAKEAADLILLEHDLGILQLGVTEGRRTFANIRKYLMMGTSSNFGNMFSMAGAAAFLPFLPMLPAQILLNNVLYDLSESAIPLDRVDAEDVARPHVWDMRQLRNFMLVLGPVSSVFDFLTFYLLLTVLNADQPTFQTAWFIESLATQILVIFVIRTRHNPLRSRPHPALMVSSIVLLAIAIGVPFSPIGDYFGFVPVESKFFLLLGGLVLSYLVIAQLAKVLFYRFVAIVPARRIA